MGSGFRTFTAGEVLTASNVQNYLQDQVVMTFAGSAARSSAIGTANFEEGMISYLTDTDKVEAYNGTNWVQVGSSNQGLTLINTTSFSAVASQSVNDVFSATYDTYKIFVNISAGTNTANLGLRMRVSNTDNSSSNYENGLYYIGAYDSQVAGSVNSNTNTFFGGITDISSTAGASFDVTLYNPFATAYTKANWQGVGFNAISGGGVMTVTTSYTGFTVYVSSGNITGSVSTFGVNK